MGRRPYADRCHVDLAWAGLGVGDELRNRLGRNRWIYHHEVGKAGDASDRRDVADEIEIEPFVECCADSVIRTSQKERIAVGGRTHDGFRPDIATGPWPVVHDELLAEPLRQPLTQEAREDVGRTTAGGK